ncbi:hypothetical protein Ocin01_06435 [Orchesella cincta]|uniref:Cytochrome b561 domain-containing protein n=1 Tax=Orchesella cincta TaxID=48709 RepID=A0A1D2N4N9_ORCCI|nr:hypothetical protein Ocin01_06435 [Orchesella cincta]
MWPFTRHAEQAQQPIPKVEKTSFESDRTGRTSGSSDRKGSRTLQRANFSRMSKDAILARLEAKIGTHNFMQDEEEDDDTEGIKRGRKSSVMSRRFKSFMQSRRLSSRPIAIVRTSEDDILKLKEGLNQAEKGTEQLTAIPVLPADEMDSLTSEIKLWYKTRRTLKCVFFCAMLCGLSVFTASIVFALYWYAEPPPASWSALYRIGSKPYNVHMCGQLANMSLMVIGMLVFRLLPHASLSKVLLIHGCTFTCSFTVCLTSISFAISYHHTFTKNEQHFYSIHSWIGVIVIILYFLSMLTGLLVLFRPSDGVRRLHPPLSILTFMLCGASSISGIFIRALIQLGPAYKTFTIQSVTVNVCGVLILLQCIFVRLGITNFLYRRRPKPQWDVVVFRSLEALEEPFLDIHDQYESLEDWIDDVNQARLRALRVPHSMTKGH